MNPVQAAMVTILRHPDVSRIDIGNYFRAIGYTLAESLDLCDRFAERRAAHPEESKAESLKRVTP